MFTENIRCLFGTVFCVYYGYKTILMNVYHKVTNMSLICMQVMLGGKNIEEGFGIAYRVIQVCFLKHDVMFSDYLFLV